MATDTGEMSCETKSWVASAAAGLVVFLVSIWLFGWGFFISLVLGVVVLVGLGIFVTRNYCDDSAGVGVAPTAPQSQARTETDRSTASASSQPTGVVAPAAEPEPAPEPERDRTPEVPLTATPEADDAARAPQPEADTTRPETAQPETSQPEVAPVSGTASGKPEFLDAPRGQADDLKTIKGVGPKLEERLNALGVYHYSQIAAWSPDEAEWVDRELDLRGRIARDGWVDQARGMAAGGAREN